MARPIGKRIRQVLEIADSIDGATMVNLRAAMPESVPASNVCRYCARSEQLGLMEINRQSKPHTYTSVPGWRDEVNIRARKRVTADTAPLQSNWAQASSVFAMAPYQSKEKPTEVGLPGHF